LRVDGRLNEADACPPEDAAALHLSRWVGEGGIMAEVTTIMVGDTFS